MMMTGTTMMIMTILDFNSAAEVVVSLVIKYKTMNLGGP
jgi:hypothetical protein